MISQNGISLKSKKIFSKVADQQLFTRIYEAQYDAIFRLCKGYFSGEESLAADATQEVFMKVWQHLSKFRAEAKISTWLYRIAVNTCLNYLRKASVKREIKTNQLPEVAAEAYNPVMEDRLKKMYSCIQQLDRLVHFSTFLQQSTSFYRKRRVLHFVITPLLYATYIIGFVLLLPVFKQEFSNGVYLYFVFSGFGSLLVLAWFIYKANRKELSVLKKLQREDA